MVERERHLTILRILSQDRFATVPDMVRVLGISEATIRRDLTKLEAQGAIHRFRGGAELSPAALESEASPNPPKIPEQPLDARKGVLTEVKRRIARAAVALLQGDETIIIDGGSTTLHMTEFLQSHRHRLITNSFAIAQNLLDTSTNTIILAGGMLYPQSQLVLDPFDSNFYRNYSAAMIFMGVEGIDENGATNSDTQVIKAEREMLERGGSLVLLADSSKFSKRGSLFLCGFERIHTIITDSAIAPPTAEMIRSKGCELIIV